MTRLGIRRDDKVMLLMTNDYRFVETLFGIIRIGAVAVPANIKLGNDNLIFIAEHSDSRILIAHEELLDKAQAVQNGAANIEDTLLVDGDVPGMLDYESSLAAERDGFTTAQVEDDDVAMMMYTSGSTGRPKGCLLSHASKWWTARSGARAMMNVQSDRALIVGPLYHANALWGSLMPMLYVGGSAAILPDFAAVPVIEAIDRHKPTFMSGTPSMYSLLLAEREALQANDVTSFEYLSCGSAPVPEELMQEIKRVFGCEVIESYGLTEARANVLSPRWGIKKLGSCGLPVMDVEVPSLILKTIAATANPAKLANSGARAHPTCSATTSSRTLPQKR